MDFKGIDIRALNFLPAQPLLNDKRQRPAIKPVKKAEKTKLHSKNRGKPKSDGKGGVSVSKEEEAKYALEALSDFLLEHKDLKVQLQQLDQDDSFVVLIKSKSSNKILCQIPIEDVISGAFFDSKKPYGILVDLTA